MKNFACREDRTRSLQIYVKSFALTFNLSLMLCPIELGRLYNIKKAPLTPHKCFVLNQSIITHIRLVTDKDLHRWNLTNWFVVVTHVKGTSLKFMKKKMPTARVELAAFRFM